jgi:flagellin
MSLRINNNIAAINAHRNLVNTTNNLTRSMEKLSSGYKINQAADNPAGLVISEQFRAQIAGLNRAISNSEGSINMVQTAEGALNELNSLLISMRELTIHAANEGFNDIAQLEADQAEIDNAIMTIDRIAANTQFGTKKLIDGSKNNTATITTGNSTGLTIKESNLSTGNHYLTTTKTANSTATFDTTGYGVSLNGAIEPSNLTEGIHNIDVIQASAGATKLGSAVDITDAFGNGITFAAAATSAQITSAAAVAAAASSGFAGTYTMRIRYAEFGGSASELQTITVTVASDDTSAAIVSAINTAIGNNTVLNNKVEATLSATNNLVLKTTGSGVEYSVDLYEQTTTAASGSFSFTPADARGQSANDLSITVKDETDPLGHTEDIQLTEATEYTDLDTMLTMINTQLALATGAGGLGTTDGGGAGVANLQVAKIGTDQVRFTLADHGSGYSIMFNQNGSTDIGQAHNALGLTYDASSVTGTDALINFDGYVNTITKIDYEASVTDNTNVVIANKGIGEVGRGTIGISLEAAQTGGIDIGSMLLDVTASRFEVRLDGGTAAAVTGGTDTIIWNSDRSESIKMNVALTSSGGTETIYNTDQSLVFQIGPNVGQTAKISMPGMSASLLARNIAGNAFSSLSEIDVTTVAGAQDAQAIIDAAIDEVSTVRGTLGSFQKNTLESNLRNLRIASQNLQSSESSIRDTDMASEMSTFVKNQILMQAGTAMLAQGNQLPQIVLSLFQ